MKRLSCAAIALSCFTNDLSAEMLNLRVEITNISPSDGVTITPPWVGFHSGSFDSYNGGLLNLHS